jgi:hypothetical protein
MKSYVVSYDLIKRKNYPELLDALKQFNYWHCLDSFWIIKSDSTAEQIYNYLRPHIDGDDRLIVILLYRESVWTPSFSTECQNWLRTNL